jgi:hypothetical protein
VSFVGIEFAIGTSLRGLPISSLIDGGAQLPDTTRRSFQLAGSRWERPGPDDVEALVERFVRHGAVVRVVLRFAPRRDEGLVAAPTEHQCRGLGEFLTFERERLGQELDVLDHPTTAAMAV